MVSMFYTVYIMLLIFCCENIFEFVYELFMQFKKKIICSYTVYFSELKCIYELFMWFCSCMVYFNVFSEEMRFTSGYTSRTSQWNTWSSFPCTIQSETFSVSKNKLEILTPFCHGHFSLAHSLNCHWYWMNAKLQNEKFISHSWYMYNLIYSEIILQNMVENNCLLC